MGRVHSQRPPRSEGGGRFAYGAIKSTQKIFGDTLWIYSFGRGGVMNKIIIDSLSNLPDEDLVAFVNCTASDAAITFAECMMQEARVVYSFTRWDGHLLRRRPIERGEARVREQHVERERYATRTPC